jgi:hypothetical protein
LSESAVIKSKTPKAVIPAKAGIHFRFGGKIKMDPGLRRDDAPVVLHFSNEPAALRPDNDAVGFACHAPRVA